ncbi:MAG: hypothetical protein PHT94_02120 [Candidatus Nanoarchaeia archaeon]|nr:hypothetical protein [Candidatus Nanoarchaeia archaeon]
MSKKCVSPLIATVLLIAFTVAIGSVVMNWGTTYIKSEQESATSTSDVRLKCATDVNLKLMKIKGMQDYCYTNDSENVTISVRLTKGNENLKGIRANIISNEESQSSNYNKEIDELNFQINLGGFSIDIIKNDLIEYLELVPYIDNNGLDYYCSGSRLVISDLYSCDFEINNPYTPNEIEDPEDPEDPEQTGDCTTYLDCPSGQFCDIYGFNNPAGTCVDFCQGGPEKIDKKVWGIQSGEIRIGLEYTQSFFGSNFTIDSDWNYSCQSYGTTLNDDLCPEEMAFINKLGGYCIDKYEAHAINMTTNESLVLTTFLNDTTALMAGSSVNKSPWVNINLSQAQQACENAGKYLCTNSQWQGAANLNGQLHNLDTMDTYGCVVSSLTYCINGNYYANLGSGTYACKTGYNKNGPNNCVSYEGVYDLFGNVYDTVNDTIDREGSNIWNFVSDEGYWISEEEDIYQGAVFFWISNMASVRRGGCWSTGTNAGPFCGHLFYQGSIYQNYYGFRCCSDIK